MRKFMMAAAFALPMFGAAAMAQETVNIAYIDPLSGGGASIGEIGLKTFQFIAEELNAKGGVLGKKVEIVPFGAALEGRTYSGRDGVRHWLTEVLSLTWDRFETIPTDYRAAGDQLVVYGHWSARVRASGTEIEMPATWVVGFRDGLRRTIDWYLANRELAESRAE